MTMTHRDLSIDPIKYGIFTHRLFNILEEGRKSMQMVSGSAVVVEGGETMCAFYRPDGMTILVAAGILLHATGGADFVRKCIEWYEENPGIYEGDQFFFNDPYIGGQHLPDQVIIKPIFYEGQLIAWTGSIMHTPEVGGLSPGGMPPAATEIFHEGIRISGLKIIEKGKFRKDVFNTLVRQVRDPHLMGLDIKAKIAANNVCARRYLELVTKFGLNFVQLASERIIDNAATMAKARLRNLPDGVWRSRLYGDAPNATNEPFKVVCTMIKQGEEVTFDYTGSSPAMPGPGNSTLTATWGSLFVVLCSQLFPGISWNYGMTEVVRLIAPEGSVLNPRYPAACSLGVTTVGKMVCATAHDCIAKMLYAGEEFQDVNAGWPGIAVGGLKYGGQSQYGDPIAGTILDGFAGGLGATPVRDGIDTGGAMMNPQSKISDVELIETYLPFLYLSRCQATNTGGFGQFRGGMGLEIVYMVYGTEKMSIGFSGGGIRVPPGLGLFGGYPPPSTDIIYVRDSDVRSWFAESRVPMHIEDALDLNGNIHHHRTQERSMLTLRNYDLVFNRLLGGGGFGDPLDRDSNKVLDDFKMRVISRDIVQHVYGVVIDETTMKVDNNETVELRLRLTEQRIGPLDQDIYPHKTVQNQEGLHIHPNLQITLHETNNVIKCRRCQYVFGPATENYKHNAVLITGIPQHMKQGPLSGDTPIAVYQQWICPRCGILLQVDVFSPEMETEESAILWDIQVTVC